MKKATSKKIAKTVKNLSKKVNRNAKRNPVGTVAAGAAIATTSAIGVGTIITGLIRMPGMIKKRFSKVDLPDEGNNNQNSNNADNTDATTTTADTTATEDK